MMTLFYKHSWWFIAINYFCKKATSSMHNGGTKHIYVWYHYQKYYQNLVKDLNGAFCENCYILHCVKSVRIRSYSCPYFPAFGLNTERYFVWKYKLNFICCPSSLRFFFHLFLAWEKDTILWYYWCFRIFLAICNK